MPSLLEPQLTRLLRLAQDQPFAALLSAADDRPGPTTRTLLDRLGPWQEVQLDAGEPPYGRQSGEPRLRLVHGLHFLAPGRRRELYRVLNQDRDQIGVRGLQLLLWCQRARLAELLDGTPDLTSWTRGVWEVGPEPTPAGLGLEEFPRGAMAPFPDSPQGSDRLALRWLERELGEEIPAGRSWSPLQLVDPALTRAATVAAAIARQRAARQRVTWFDGPMLDSGWLSARIAAGAPGELLCVVGDGPWPEGPARQLQVCRQDGERLVGPTAEDLQQWHFVEPPLSEQAEGIYLASSAADREAAEQLAQRIEASGLPLVTRTASSALSPADRSACVTQAAAMLVVWTEQAARDGWLLHDLALGAWVQRQRPLPVFAWSLEPDAPPVPLPPEPTIRPVSDRGELQRSLTARPTEPADSSALTVWQQKLSFLRREEPITVDPDAKFRLGKLIEEAQDRIRELQAAEEGAAPGEDLRRGLFQATRPAARLPAALSFEVVEALTRSFGAASRVLLGWPQEAGGLWLERPELERLHELATQAEPVVTVLLGGPGSGKSALLARLGERLRDQGVVLLALKADQLPRQIATLAELDRFVGGPRPVVEALRQLAEGRRVVLLIDQLDALAELMDQHTERLASLLRLVDSVRGVPNLQIILSCREFEYRNDVRLRTLQTRAVTLALPTAEQVTTLLTDRGLDPRSWSAEALEVLRTPLHLSVFLEHLAAAGPPSFATYHGMLEQVLDRIERECGPRAIELAERIAATMGEEEELTLGTARFRADRAELLKLEAAGLILHPEKSRLTFRHQTMADFLRARAFLSHGQSVAEFVIERRQASLFVRPVLWSTLTYLRQADPAVYRRELDTLWQSPGLRAHLRYLLVAFLGQQTDPRDEEARWLLPLLTGEDPVLMRKALFAMAGSPGWFRRLACRLPVLLAAPPERVAATVWLLNRAAAFARDEVLGLLERYWLGREELHPAAIRVLEGVEAWDERASKLAGSLVEHEAVPHGQVWTLAEQIGSGHPELASGLLARRLQADLRRIQTTAVADPAPLPEDATEVDRLLWRMRADDALHAPFEHLLSEPTWDGLPRLAERAPAAFLEALWGWLIQLLEALAEQGHQPLQEYRRNEGRAFLDVGSFHAPPLPEAFVTALQAFARKEPAQFLDWVRTQQRSDLMQVHSLLVEGLEQLCSLQPDSVLEYLLADPRRLAIGDHRDRVAGSRRLIAALVPALDSSQAGRLEQAIVEAWRPGLMRATDARYRLLRQKWARGYRLRLLRSFPADRLSMRARRLRATEERALPGTPERDYESGMVLVDSPMSSQQMALATDHQILNLFRDLVNGAGRQHRPGRRGREVGGLMEASQAFASFAREHPERAVRLLERFDPGPLEWPTGHALVALAESGAIDGQELIAKVHALAGRGFSSEEFRREAARCLSKLAGSTHGLDDATCALLESWLTSWDEQASTSRPTHHMPEQQTPKGPPESLLWGMGGGGILPGGNFPILEALLAGYAQRSPTDFDGWLALLERHLDRPEDPAVWAALANRLDLLVSADRDRATAFLRELFDRVPSVLRCVAGVQMVARLDDWLAPALLETALGRWLSEDWPPGPQAAGEITVLHWLRHPLEATAAERVERYVASGGPVGLRLGLAYALTEGWRSMKLRVLAHPFLLRLIPEADSATAWALQRVFVRNDALPADRATCELLRALVRYPGVLAEERGTFLVERLEELLRAGFEPGLVGEVVAALIARTLSRPGHPGWQTKRLVQLALTLHRIPETREQGLTLFERLLAMEAYGVDDQLRLLDRRPFRS